MKQASQSDEALLKAALEAARRETADGLDDVRASAVYRQIDDRIRTPSAWWASMRRPLLIGGPLAAAAAAGLIAVAINWPAPVPAPRVAAAPPATARVVFRNGAVDLRSTAGDSPLSPKTTELGTEISVEPEADARIDLEVNGQARLAVFGPARVRRGSRGAFTVEEGAAQFSVEPHKPGAPFVVQAGRSEIVVLGTEFFVQVQQGRLVNMTVLEGRVEVRSLDGPRSSTKVYGPGEALREAHASGELAQPDDIAFARPWWNPDADHQQPRGYLVVESEPARAQVSLDGKELGATPLLVRWPAGAHDVRVELPGKEIWQEAVQMQAGRLKRVVASLLDLTAPTKARAPQSRPHARDRWEVARALLDAGRCLKLDRVVEALIEHNPEARTRARAELLSAECHLQQGKKRRALGLYRRIADRYPETTSAEAALFEIAKLQSDLGQPRQGLASMERYLARYPEGRFTEGATMRRCELLARFKRLGEARTCLEHYRRDFPGGLRASQAVLLLATIARVEGRWSDAAWLYRDYLARAPRSTKAEPALFHLIQCLRWGKLEGVVAAAAEYLKRFPEGEHAEEVRQWREAGSQIRDR